MAETAADEAPGYCLPLANCHVIAKEQGTEAAAFFKSLTMEEDFSSNTFLTQTQVGELPCDTILTFTAK